MLQKSADNLTFSLVDIEFLKRDLQVARLDAVSTVVHPTDEGYEFARLCREAKGHPEKIDAAVREQFAKNTHKFSPCAPYDESWLSRLACRAYVSELLLRNWALPKDDVGFPEWEVPLHGINVILPLAQTGGWRLSTAPLRNYDVVGYADLCPENDIFGIKHWGMSYAGQIISKQDAQNVYRHELGGITAQPLRVFKFRHDDVHQLHARSVQGAHNIYNWECKDGAVVRGPSITISIPPEPFDDPREWGF